MRIMIGCLTAIILSLNAAPALAHDIAVVVTDDGEGVRCYQFSNFDHGDVEFWIESNGVLTGGVPDAAGSLGVPGRDGTGLHRFPLIGPDGLSGTADDTPADTELSADEWLLYCA